MRSFPATTLVFAAVVLATTTATATEVPQRNLRTQHSTETSMAPPPVGFVDCAKVYFMNPGTVNGAVSTNANMGSTVATNTLGAYTATNTLGAYTANNNMGSTVVGNTGVANSQAVSTATSNGNSHTGGSARPAQAGTNNGLLGGFGPVKKLATMAHHLHGAILGHTDTLKSKYMKANPDGPSGGH
jgi:hypothetical protein